MKKNETTSDTNWPRCTTEFRVRFNETDALGIVWHGNYIGYLEEAREAFGRKFGLTYQDALDAGFSTPVVKTVCEHLLPLRYGDIFFVETQFVNTETAKIVFRYQIFNKEKNLVCRGESVQVFWDAQENLQLYAPEFFLRWKQQFL